MLKNFIFVNEPFEFDEKEIELIPGYRIKRPNETQLKAINRFIQNLSHILNMINIFKYTSIKIQVDERTTNAHLLPEEKWRYTIIEFDKHQADYNFIESLLLIDTKITGLMEIYLTLPGIEGETFGYGNFDILTSFVAMSNHNNEPKKIIWKESDKETMSNIYEFLKKSKDQGIEARFALNAFNSYKRLHSIEEKNVLRALGLYSIIEYFLVHNPRTDFESITNQFVKKYKFINNRFENKLDINSFFNSSAKSENLLKMIYKYRSLIAHGSFEGIKGEIQELKSEEYVLSFLNLYVKRLIIQTLKEPRLVMDLKDL